MTLIVARMLADGPHLVCDSQLTDPDRQCVNPYSAGALKLIICDRGLCIGFAGGVHTGLQTILDVTAGGSGADLARVRRKLKAYSHNSGL